MPHACHEAEHRGMIVARLAVLGFDLIVVLLGVMLTHRRWVSHQPGAARQRSASSMEVSGAGTYVERRQPSRVKGYREIRILLMARNGHFRPRMLAGKEEAA